MKKIVAIGLLVFGALSLSGCTYMPYWSGHDAGAAVTPSEKEVLDAETTCRDLSYIDGYPDDENYIQGCIDAWVGN